MKNKIVISIVVITFLLTACIFTISEDFDISSLNVGKRQLLLMLDNENITAYEGEKALASIAIKDKKIINFCSDDLDHDGKDELLVLTGLKDESYAESLTVYSFDNNRFLVKADFLLKRFNPWKVQTADVDGDGVREISIGVYKKAIFHQEDAKRPFVYSWKNNNLVPKWLGSRLSRPFDDYIFEDIDNDGLDELISIETLQNKQKILCSYKWKGFGFEELHTSEQFEGITNLSKGNDKGKVSANILNSGKWIDKMFHLVGDKLISIGN